jgi:hypothetical protein
MLPSYEDETSAIHRRDPEAARAACVSRSYLMAQTMVAELVRRRVFAAPGSVGHVDPGRLGVLAGADAVRSGPPIAL